MKPKTYKRLSARGANERHGLIHSLRAKGAGFVQICRETGVHPNTVRYYLYSKRCKAGVPLVGDNANPYAPR